MNGLTLRIDSASVLRFAGALRHCVEAAQLDGAAADALLDASVGELVHFPRLGPIVDGVVTAGVHPSPALLAMLPGLHAFYPPEGAAMPP